MPEARDLSLHFDQVGGAEEQYLSTLWQKGVTEVCVLMNVFILL